MYAENMKSKGDRISKETRMMLEVYIPSFSIICLIGVTIYVTNEAVAIIIKPPHPAEEVDITFLYGFAAFNFIVDLISGYVFLRGGKKAFISINNRISVTGDCAVTSVSTDGFVRPQANDANLNMLAGN
jgi:membrane-bound ClpP family serine protease